MRGGCEAYTLRGDRGSGQGQGGGWTCRTGAPLRVGKRHHVVRGVHFQTPFLLCSRTRDPALTLCVYFRPAARMQNSFFCRCACALCIVLVLRCVLCLVSVFVVALYLQFTLTLLQCSEC